MRIQIIVNFFLLISLSSTFSQDSAILYLEGNKLVGIAENEYYTGFEIELDTNYTKLDSLSLFTQFPRIGKFNFKNRREIPTEYTLTERAGYAQIMFRFRTSYYTFDNLEIGEKSIRFKIDDDPEVPVVHDDLKIVRLAKNLLSEEQYWHKNDDRECSDDLANKSYSIYCALRLSSLEVENIYNHRSAVLQKLRHLIEQKYPDRKWNHRLMDFNNMEETTYKDVLAILNEIEEYFIRAINEKIAR